MENAAQTLGRLRAIAGVDADAVTIDLRAANLQGIDFEGGNFNRRAAERRAVAGGKAPAARRCRGQTSDAQMQGANLVRADAGGRPADAQMQGASLDSRQLQGAILARNAGATFDAQMQGANLAYARDAGGKPHARADAGGDTLFIEV